MRGARSSNIRPWSYAPCRSKIGGASGSPQHHSRNVVRLTSTSSARSGSRSRSSAMTSRSSLKPTDVDGHFRGTTVSSMASSGPERLISDMRGVRYGEVLAVFMRDTGLEAEVYGTQMLHDCPQEWWDTLDADEIAKDMGAIAVKLNGPRYWTLDGFG